jgi:hypothetical protein
MFFITCIWIEEGVYDRATCLLISISLISSIGLGIHWTLALTHNLKKAIIPEEFKDDNPT